MTTPLSSSLTPRTGIRPGADVVENAAAKKATEAEAAAKATALEAETIGDEAESSQPEGVSTERAQAARVQANAADVAIRLQLERSLPGVAVNAAAAGTAVDGPGMTPPGERILDHDWVQSSQLGEVTIEQIYEPVSAGKNWRNEELANIFAGTDLEFNNDYDTQAIRFSYTTQDRGELKQATGVMVVPLTDEAKDLPMMLTLHGYSGMNAESAVSAGWDEGRQDAYNKLTNVVASSGKIVVLPDYIGLDANGGDPGQRHPMLVAEPTAIASLDAVRAARRLLVDLNRNDGSAGAPHTAATAGDTVVWGGSQGGHAAAAVARYQPVYAPDVGLTAVGMGAPPLDARAQLHEGVEHEKSLYHSGAMFMGMADWYGVPLNEVFQGDFAKTIPEAFASGSAEEVQERLEGLTAKDVLQPDVYAAAMDPSFAGNPLWSGILAENSFPHSKAIPPSSGVPMHLAIASDDELVDPALTRQSFEALVEQGDKVQYLECKASDHSDGAFAKTLDDAVRFLDQALEGRELPIGMGVRLNAQDCVD